MAAVPNTQDVGVDKPMVLKDDSEKKTNPNRKQSHGFGLFKKKSSSNQDVHAAEEAKHNDSHRHGHSEKSKKSKKKSDHGSNVFSKLFGKNKHKNDSNASSSANKQINAKMKEEEMEASRTVRMLLLGAGGSGKTTVFKQMEKMYKGDVDEKQLEAGKEDIYRNILADIHELCKFNIKQNSTESEKFKLSSGELNDACHRISNWPSHYILEDPKSRLTRSLAVDIDRLWQDDAMKETWKLRKKSHVMDNTPYFFSKILEIVPDPDDQKAEEWKCTFEDFVRVRDQTTGIIVKHFLVDTELGRYNFEVTDVGGQRSERRKWMRLFDNISVVVYIMSLSAYDQNLYEDNTKRCWDETLELFTKTSRHSVFDRTDWVIFFNKVDLFEEKIKTVPFTIYEPNFNADHAHDSQMVKDFIREQFKERFYDLPEERKKKRGNLYFHVTCATNSDEVSIILQKVQMDLIKSQMKKMGYLL